MFGLKTFAALALAATAASAQLTVRSSGSFRAPVKPIEQVVFRPEITSPTEGAIWEINTTQTVTWDTSAIPPEGRNQTGLILLGYVENGTSSEHLDTVSPLAVGFPITAGEVNVTVPVKAPRDDYVLVLFGDSGNTSPKFSIVLPSA